MILYTQLKAANQQSPLHDLASEVVQGTARDVPVKSQPEPDAALSHQDGTSSSGNAKEAVHNVSFSLNLSCSCNLVATCPFTEDLY